MPTTETLRSPPLTPQAKNKAKVSAQGNLGNLLEEERMLGGQSQQKLSTSQVLQTADRLPSSEYLSAGYYV